MHTQPAAQAESAPVEQLEEPKPSPKAASKIKSPQKSHHSKKRKSAYQAQLDETPGSQQSGAAARVRQTRSSARHHDVPHESLEELPPVTRSSRRLRSRVSPDTVNQVVNPLLEGKREA